MNIRIFSEATCDRRVKSIYQDAKIVILTLNCILTLNKLET